MIKIVDLGFEVPETGERRVSLIDDAMIKTASNDIQDFWRDFTRETGKGYLHVIAMTDGNHYGPNNNGDWFDEKDLKQYHPSFTKDGHVFMFHVNKDPQKSIGKPIYSFYNDHMHRIELVLEFQKNNPGAVMLVQKLRDGEQVYVSMGVKVSHDICSICNNKSKTRAEYCDHLRFNMKKILPDGRQVYAINPGPHKYFDISIVNRPADKVAWALEKEASEHRCNGVEIEKTSAELGEEYEFVQAKLAGLKKFSDMVKEVEGDIADGDTQDSKYSILKDLRKQKVKHLDYPVLDYETMDGMDVSPGGLIRVIVSMGAPPSISEMAYASGKHMFGNRMSEDVLGQIIRLLPAAISFLRQRPGMMDSMLPSMLSNYDNELSEPNRYHNLVLQAKPVMTRRIMLIKSAASKEEMGEFEKRAEVLRYKSIPPYNDTIRGKPTRSYIVGAARDVVNSTALHPNIGSLDQHQVIGPDGKILNTSQHNIQIASKQGKFLGVVGELLGASILTAGGISMFSDATALEKALITLLSAGVGVPLMMAGRHNTIETREGMEIPNNTVMHRSTQFSEKTAETATEKVLGINKEYLPALYGMAIPSILGLDYLYNKHVKYRNEPYPEQAMESPISRAAYRAGRIVGNNKITTIGGAGLTGVMLDQYLKSRKK